MRKISRNKDVVLGVEDLESLYTFKDFPVFMGCTDSSDEYDMFFDMNWNISRGSGMIQLNPLLPLEIVYADQHGSGTTGKAWNEHHEAFSKFVHKYKVKNVLEIGGLHGILAEKYMSLDNGVKWTIIDPNPVAKESGSLKIIRGFFDNNFVSEDTYDAVIHSHLIEHIYDVNEFMSHKSSFMKNGDLLIFSLPNMKAMLQNKYTNCLNFEHTAYLIEPYVEYFLYKHKFKLIDKEYFRNDHSIFYCAAKDDGQVELRIESQLYQENKQTFLDYISYHTEDVALINKQIENNQSPVFLFGAHIFSQHLIAFGLNTKKIQCILDNDVKKQGKRLYGTKMHCKSPEVLRDLPHATIILRAGVYNQEIKKGILDNINPNVSFI